MIPVGSLAARPRISTRVAGRRQRARRSPGRIDGEEPAIAVALRILNIKQRRIILRPDKSGDAAIGVVGHRARLIHGPHRHQPDVAGPIARGEERHSVAAGRQLRARTRGHAKERRPRNQRRLAAPALPGRARSAGRSQRERGKAPPWRLPGGSTSLSPRGNLTALSSPGQRGWLTRSSPLRQGWGAAAPGW